MASTDVEIWYHPNSGQTFLVDGNTRLALADIPGVGTVAQQVAVHISKNGAIDRRPGALAEVVGLDAIRGLESLRAI